MNSLGKLGSGELVSTLVSIHTWMGAHSTFEDHLKGVQAFHSPRADDELDRNVKKKDSKKALKESKSSKHKDSGKHQKEKRKRQGGRTGRRKSIRIERKQDVRNSDQSSSDEDIDTQLEKGRAAVRITRDILGQNPGLKQELRQVTVPPPAGLIFCLLGCRLHGVSSSQPH